MFLRQYLIIFERILNVRFILPFYELMYVYGASNLAYASYSA